MLRGIDPLLRGELLAHLDSLGHGDSFVIVDANFPARRLGRRVVDLPGVAGPDVARAVFSVAPADPDEALVLMQSPTGRPDVQQQLVDAADRHAGAGMQEVERHAFYELARNAELIIATGELRAYGNLLARKAGILPE